MVANQNQQASTNQLLQHISSLMAHLVPAPTPPPTYSPDNPTPATASQVNQSPLFSSKTNLQQPPRSALPILTTTQTVTAAPHLLTRTPKCRTPITTQPARPVRHHLCWILILVTVCRIQSASATAPTSLPPLSRTCSSTSAPHIPITPTRPRTSTPNQSRPPASFGTNHKPENKHYGDSLDDYLHLLDQGKAFQQVDPGQGLTPDAVWKEQTM
jgi:hypothetical protein